MSTCDQTLDETDETELDEKITDRGGKVPEMWRAGLAVRVAVEGRGAVVAAQGIAMLVVVVVVSTGDQMVLAYNGLFK